MSGDKGKIESARENNIPSKAELTQDVNSDLLKRVRNTRIWLRM